MKKLLIILFFFLSLASFSQTTKNTFTQYTGDLARPGAGAETWIGQWTVSGIPGPIDDYVRYHWATDFQPGNSTATQFNWTALDGDFQNAIRNNRKVSFGVMHQCGACGPDSKPTVAGGGMVYPQFLHTQMQAQTHKDYISGGEWIANYNGAFLTAWKRLHDSISYHINHTSYNGVPFSSVLRWVDVNGMGDYGEWTNNASDIVSGDRATVATKDSIIAYVVRAYPNTKCQLLNATFDGNQLSNTQNDPLVGYFALNIRNNTGLQGYRRESWGNPASFYSSWTNTNPTVVSGYHFDTAITNRYKFAPITGEMQDACQSSHMSDLQNQITTYHVLSFGNGNLDPGCEVGNSTAYANIVAASKLAGYRIQLDSTISTTTPTSGGQYIIKSFWRNAGTTPSYDHWYVKYKLFQGTSAVWTGVSKLDPYLFLPSGSNTQIIDTFALAGVPSGAGYVLQVSIEDVNAYQRDMPLFITTTQNANGGYTLRTGITVANNGTNATVNLIVIQGESNASGEAYNPDIPAGVETGTRTNTKIWNNSANAFQSLLIGTNNDVNEGNVASRHGMELALANAVDSLKLTQPTYVVKVGYPGSTIDQWRNGGSTTSPINDPTKLGWSVVTARVDAAIAYLNANSIPYKLTVWQSIGINDYNAGTTNSTFTTKMQQFESDFRTRYGSTVPFIRTLFFSSHPYSAVIQSMSDADAQGVDRAVFTDDAKRTSNGAESDAPNGAHWTYSGFKTFVPRMVTATGFAANNPVANAGIDQTITLPTSSVTLDGTNSSGTIVSYGWTKVSGPNTPTIVSASSSTTSVTGLIAGTYVFQLALNGSVSTDRVTIVVNAAIPPGTTIFTTQVPKVGTDNDIPGGANPTTGQEVGVRFTSTIAGFITGIRFYKTDGNIGTHIGELYSNSGTRLAAATFTSETTNGWQTVSFPTPVAITANTPYVAAYYSASGYYTEENDYFKTTGVTNTQLSAPADATGGASGNDPGNGQGLYIYSSTPAFPNQLYRSANYWVDIQYSPTPAGQITVPFGHIITFQTITP